MIDGVGVGNDQALLCLTENFIETNRCKPSACQKVAKHVASPYRGELIGVTDDDKPRTRLDSAQKRSHQRVIHHRCLVNNNGMLVEQIVFASLEMCVTARLTAAVFE